MIKAIVVDDHELFRFGVKAALEKYHPDICITGEAETGADLFELLKKDSPDMVLLNVNLPDMSGVEMVKRLKEENPELKVLALSSQVSDSLTKMLIDVGVSGFISKRMCSIHVLADSIHSVTNGLEYFGTDISAIIHRIYVQKRNPADITSELTESEKKIIKLCQKKLSSKQIAEQLNISFRTVDSHKNNIFKKFHIHNTKEMVNFTLEKEMIKG